MNAARPTYAGSDNSLEYSSKQVMAKTGVTYRQLNHWIARGLIEGQGHLGSGFPRYWTAEQLARVGEIKEGIDLIDGIVERYQLKPMDLWSKRTDADHRKKAS